MLGKLALPFVSKSVGVTGAAASGAAAGALTGPVGAVIGAVGGIGVDYSINHGA